MLPLRSELTAGSRPGEGCSLAHAEIEGLRLRVGRYAEEVAYDVAVDSLSRSAIRTSPGSDPACIFRMTCPR
jgi:hypothetical protein